MKELLQQLAAFHLWANQRIVDCLNEVPEELLNKELPSSLKSIHLTLLHLWDVENIWWQRVRLVENVSYPAATFKGTNYELGLVLLQQSGLWNNWVQNASEAALTHVFHYYDKNQALHKQPVYQALVHMFNHATYHRGQIVNMLRQAGITKIPNTDFIMWTWNKSRK